MARVEPPRRVDLRLTLRRVLRLWLWGIEISEIADRLDLGEDDVRCRAYQLRRRGFDVPRRSRAECYAKRHASRTERACMTCQGAFLSEGFHNRMCARCKEAAWGRATDTGDDIAHVDDIELHEAEQVAEIELVRWGGPNRKTARP